MGSTHLLTKTNKQRARALGIPFQGEPGRDNAITDVVGVEVGYRTLIRGHGPLVVGQGPVRTGVTAIHPRGRVGAGLPVFAGVHSLNGNGEMTGFVWIEEAGRTELPIVITNTHPAGALPCYSVEQALAEKLRAWLQKLPPYLNKIGSSEAPPRVRDLRDIHVLLELDPSALDWDLLGRSFVDKCKVRFVDCCSTADLLPEGVSLDLVRSLYEAEDALRDVPFDRAWESIHGLVTRLHERGAMPGIVPLPEP
jgi:hypothetical protein